MALNVMPVGTVTTADAIVAVQFEIPQGKSAVIQSVREQAREIAAQQSPVLITGEPGSGRDLFGRFIHQESDRAAAPFILISAAALTDDTVVEQFIGHEGSGGAGLLQQAAHGTLFISELQELGRRGQSFLLGLIEQGQYTPSGQSSAVPITARIMASVQSASSDSLRADLLAALGVMQLTIPPLRKYSEDIPELLRQYVHTLVSEESLSFRRFGVAVQNRLRNYPWPGNLRELKSLVRRLLIQNSSPEVTLAELEDSLVPADGGGDALVKQDILALPMREAREQFERAYLSQQLALCGGKVGKLAQRVGMERTHLYRKLRALGIDFGQGGD
jgi:DNA-binding NtrC family response regulator